MLAKGDFGSVTWLDKPLVEFPAVPTLSAQDTQAYVAAHAGASLYRDDADKYVLAELESFGKKGAIIRNETSLGLAGGVGTLPTGTAPADTDRDGMPDVWESAHGLNPGEAADGNGLANAAGYTNLEIYLSSLVP